MTTTSVGMRCPECASDRTKVVRARTQPMVNHLRVTYALIAINVIAFLTEKGQFTVSGDNLHGSVINNGVLYRGGILAHQYFRLVSSAFLHENFLHIAFNMYLLYLLGRLLEPAIGSIRFTAIYVVSLLAGSAGVLVATATASLGASGAIFGLMGAAAVELRARGVSVMQSGIGMLIILNLVISFTFAGISVGAHIGGLIGGALAGLAIRFGDSRRSLALGLGLCALLCVLSVVISLASAHAAPGVLA